MEMILENSHEETAGSATNMRRVPLGGLGASAGVITTPNSGM
jgi:hypothetical protein